MVATLGSMRGGRGILIGSKIKSITRGITKITDITTWAKTPTLVDIITKVTKTHMGILTKMEGSTPTTSSNQ